MNDGEKIRFRGKADEEPGVEAGDIVIILRVSDHDVFQRKGSIDLLVLILATFRQQSFDENENRTQRSADWIHQRSYDTRQSKNLHYAASWRVCSARRYSKPSPNQFLTRFRTESRRWRRYASSPGSIPERRACDPVRSRISEQRMVHQS